ncbi:MAG: alpha/beta fold hydrolase [Janthinobacterium lividum]
MHHFHPRSFFQLIAVIIGLAGLAAAPAAAQKARPPSAGAPALPTGELAFRTSDSVRLFAKVAGRGVPCVFVHGGPGAGSYAFEQLAGRALEGQFQMVYLDQRGSGRSASAPGHDYRLDRQVQDLEELRQRLGLQQWVLLAHSFGGVIATAYAQRYPARVRALVLANAVLNPSASLASMVHYGDSLLPAAARPQLPLTAPLPQQLGAVMQALGQQRMMYQLQYASDTTAARAGRVARQVPGNPDFAAHVFDFPEYGQDYAPATAALAMPVLVLAGHDDYTAGPRHYRSFRFPHQQVVVLPGRHNAFVEQPAAAQRAVRTFAAALPGRR